MCLRLRSTLACSHLGEIDTSDRRASSNKERWVGESRQMTQVCEHQPLLAHQLLPTRAWRHGDDKGE